MPATEFAKQPMLYTPSLPDDDMHPFVLADVRPVSRARLVALPASTTAHVAQRILRGREVTVVPLALTANLTPELTRVALTGVPQSWYRVHARRDDDRPELATAIELMSHFTESLSRAAVAVVSCVAPGGRGDALGSHMRVRNPPEYAKGFAPSYAKRAHAPIWRLRGGTRCRRVRTVAASDAFVRSQVSQICS